MLKLFMQLVLPLLGVSTVLHCAHKSTIQGSSGTKYRAVDTYASAQDLRP